MKKSTTTIDLFITLLAVAFIVLKVANVIDWSWIWVLSPIWISCLVAIALIPFKIKMTIKAEESKSYNKFFEQRLKNLKK